MSSQKPTPPSQYDTPDYEPTSAHQHQGKEPNSKRKAFNMVDADPSCQKKARANVVSTEDDNHFQEDEQRIREMIRRSRESLTMSRRNDELMAWMWKQENGTEMSPREAGKELWETTVSSGPPYRPRWRGDLRKLVQQSSRKDV